MNIPALLFSFSYLSLGMLWISYNGGGISVFNSIGFLFIFITSVFIYLLIRRSSNQSVANKKLYQKLFENSPSPMWIYEDHSLRFLAVNKTAIHKYGFTREEFLQLKLEDIRPPEGISALYKSLKNRKSEHEHYNEDGPFLHRKKNGETFYVQINSRPTIYLGKKSRLVVAMDVSEKKYLEESIAQREKLLSSVVNSQSSYLIRFNESDQFTYANDRFLEQFELDGSSLKKLNFLSTLLPEDVEKFKLARKSCHHHPGKIISVELRLINSKNILKWTSWEFISIANTGNGFGEIQGMGQDIHQQKKYQEEIKKLSLVAEKTQNAVVITGKDGRIEWVNEGFTRLTGWDAEEVVNTRPSKFLDGPATDAKTLHNIACNLLKKQKFSEELICYKKDKQAFWMRVDISPILDEAGELIKFISIGTDITERKQFEQRLQNQNQQLKEIAWISSHDIRRPVASILGLISLYDQKDPSIPFNQEIINLLNVSTKELDKVIRTIVYKTYEVDEMNEEAILREVKKTKEYPKEKNIKAEMQFPFPQLKESSTPDDE